LPNQFEPNLAGIFLVSDKSEFHPKYFNY
jgi:hypothetical protein